MSNKILIDEFLPDYQFVEKHEIDVRASAEEVYQAINSTNLADSWIIRGLLSLRGLGRPRLKTLTLRDMTKEGFAILGEKPNGEILLGLAGKFWSITGCLQEINAENFREFDKKGFAKAVWNFALIEKSENEIHLTTETRVQCLDKESLASFRFYWRFIKPFSGWIRREMLQLIKKEAENRK
jgi:hypothetical protein